LVCFFIILSCVVGLLYYLIELLIKKFFIKNKRKSRKTPFKWASLIPFLPSMIIGFILEIVLRSPLLSIL
jgi:prepilin signal peptidase PulO-like enzyme (type II secretory pathway)